MTTHKWRVGDSIRINPDHDSDFENTWYTAGEVYVITRLLYEGSIPVYNVEGVGDGSWVLQDDAYFYAAGSGPDEPVEDKGKHYRYSFRLNLTQKNMNEGFVMVNIDPYRISEVYNLGGWREHVLKKTIRGTDKGHSALELIEEIRCCIDRAEQMIKESAE